MAKKETVIKKCNECEGKLHAMNPCLKGKGKGKIMIVGDLPSMYEDNLGKMFITDTSKFLFEELKFAGIPLDKCYFTKAVKCFHSDNTPLKQTMINCKKLLDDEIDAIEPIGILLYGGVALKTLLGLKTLTKNRGRILEYRGYKVIATVNPYLVIKQPHYAWEFRSDLAYFARMLIGWETPDTFTYEIIDDTNLEGIAKDILASDAIAYDIETSSLDETKIDGVIHMIGIATRNKVYVLEMNKDNVKLQGFLNDVLGEGKSYQKIAHNAKFDNRWLKTHNIFPYVTYDTYLAAYIINTAIPHGLKYLAKTYLGASDYSSGVEFNKTSLTEFEFEQLAKYCALDCYYTLKLYDFTLNELKKDVKLKNVFDFIVMPAERVLQKIETRGIYVDPEKLSTVITDYQRNKGLVETEIKSLMPSTAVINLNSSKQIGKLLYEDLKLPVGEATASGNYPTGKSVLLRLVEHHPIAKFLLEYRAYEKALSGFLLPWKDLLTKNPRLHTTYNIAKTSTGRLSAEKPNLQQVPRKKTIRNLISVPEGRVLIEADYSQIELRIAAYVSNSFSMKRCYKLGEDIHAKTASAVAKCRLEDVTPKQRSAAKAVNFGFLYGMWWKSFKEYAFDSYGLIVTDEEAQEARKAFFELYPELEGWHENQKQYVRKHQYVKTLLGRIRHLPNINSPDKMIKGEAERQAINTEVQSVASDMTLIAMILVDKNLTKIFNNKAFLVGQVHDSLLVEAEEDIANEAANIIKKCMESVPKVLEKYFGVILDLPIVADVTISKVWGG